MTWFEVIMIIMGVAPTATFACGYIWGYTRAQREELERRGLR